MVVVLTNWRGRAPCGDFHPPGYRPISSTRGKRSRRRRRFRLSRSCTDGSSSLVRFRGEDPWIDLQVAGRPIPADPLKGLSTFGLTRSCAHGCLRCSTTHRPARRPTGRSGVRGWRCGVLVLGQRVEAGSGVATAPTAGTRPLAPSRADGARETGPRRFRSRQDVLRGGTKRCSGNVCLLTPAAARSRAVGRGERPYGR